MKYHRAELTIRSLAAVLVFVSTLEAIYWPLIMKPGTELYWWQIEWFAKLGDWIGFPVLAIAYLVGVLPTQIRMPLVLILAVLWAFTIQWLIGLLWSYIRRRRKTA